MTLKSVQNFKITSSGLIRYQRQFYYDVNNLDYTKQSNFFSNQMACCNQNKIIRGYWMVWHYRIYLTGVLVCLFC